MLAGIHYVKHAKWVELWGDCLRVDYLPNVDVRTVKARAPKSGQTPLDATAAALQGAVAETLKYSTKPADMVADESWFPGADQANPTSAGSWRRGCVGRCAQGGSGD